MVVAHFLLPVVSCTVLIVRCSFDHCWMWIIVACRLLFDVRCLMFVLQRVVCHVLFFGSSLLFARFVFVVCLLLRVVCCLLMFVCLIVGGCLPFDACCL